MGDAISTERLVLRRIEEDDAERINACVRDPRVYRNVGKIPADQSLDETRAFIARSRAKWDADTSFGLAIMAQDTLVGMVGGGPGGPHGPFDVGYWIAPEAWGHGYATEAFAAYLGWLAAEKGQRGVTAGYFIDNPRSGHVLRKTGFLPCGRSEYFCLGRDANVACIDMARIA